MRCTNCDRAATPTACLREAGVVVCERAGCRDLYDLLESGWVTEIPV